MVKELQRVLNFNIEIFNAPDGVWGLLDEEGQWVGLIGLASRGEVDFIISDILMSWTRFQVTIVKKSYAIMKICIHCMSIQVVQTTMFYDRDFLTFASPIPAPAPRFFSLLRPFTLIVWVLVITSIISLGVVFYFISNLEVSVANINVRIL